MNNIKARRHIGNSELKQVEYRLYSGVNLEAVFTYNIT